MHRSTGRTQACQHLPELWLLAAFCLHKRKGTTEQKPLKTCCSKVPENTAGPVDVILSGAIIIARRDNLCQPKLHLSVDMRMASVAAHLMQQSLLSIQTSTAANTKHRCTAGITQHFLQHSCRSDETRCLAPKPNQSPETTSHDSQPYATINNTSSTCSTSLNLRVGLSRRT